MKQFAKNRKIYRDFILGLAAYVVTMGMLQVIIYPSLSRNFSADEYGTILVVMGVANMLIAIAGGSLNNTRLLVQADYEERGLEGDFLPVLFTLELIMAVIFMGYLAWMGKYSIVTNTCMWLFVLTGILEQYGVVIFRIHINYWKYLVFCAIMAIGNGVGLSVFLISRDKGIWPIVFLLGEAAGAAYLFFTPIFREELCFTTLFSETAKKEIVLLVTTISINMLTYLDRWFLYPLLGGEAVSTYTVASFFGKSLGVLLVPISGVLLSYYSKKEYRMDRRTFASANVWIFGLCGAFMMICYIFSAWITGLFYPTLIGLAAPFLMIANAAAVVNTAAVIIQPIILTHASTYWQLFMQAVYLLTYLGLGLWGGQKIWLMGICICSTNSSGAKIVDHVYAGILFSKA